ncbi:MAG TPA: hypothetical protein VHY22_02780 [Chthoniobacteraceae bacterium]|jgi:hypothetical protein|nr:hypothetical protein [Chthoniobacteraceae bacterium]
MDRFQLLFLGGSGLLMLVQSVRGWRVGVARQLVNLSALLAAYGGAFLAGRLATPLLRPLGYPDLLVSVLAGSIVGAAIYHSLRCTCGMLVRRTNEHSLRLLRIGCGAGGSALGFAGALMTVWLSVLAIRCLGTVAEAEVTLARTSQARRDGVTASPMAIELARMKHSLATGPTGVVFNGPDPIPANIYVILGKIAQVISSVDSMQRFATYPGTRVISQNPHIMALQCDPVVTRQVSQRDFLGLLGNPKIAALMNDPDIEGLVRNFQLEKALDYALAGSAGAGRAGR